MRIEATTRYGIGDAVRITTNRMACEEGDGTVSPLVGQVLAIRVERTADGTETSYRILLANDAGPEGEVTVPEVALERFAEDRSED